MNKILVTGAAGFIGSHTVDYLTEKRYKVVAVDDFSTGKTENLRNFHGSIEVCDITDERTLEGIFHHFRPNAVIHLAAQSAITKAWGDPLHDMNVNIKGTLNLLNLAVKYKTERFVFASTSAVYGKGNLLSASKETDPCDPDTPYGISKLASEHYIRILFKNHAILRYANVYGPRQTPIGENQVIARAFDHFMHGADFSVIGNGHQKRDFVYVGDVAIVNYLAVTNEKTGTFNVSSGKSISVNDALFELEKYHQVEGYRWSHTDTIDERGSVFINGSKLKRTFGWKPSLDMASGIHLTAEWWRNPK